MQSIVYTVSAVRVGSKCNLSFCQSLKSFQPTNYASFHMSGRAPTSMEKCFAADHESFRRGTVRRSAAAKKKRKKKKLRKSERDAKNGARSQCRADRKPRCAWHVFSFFSLPLSLPPSLSLSPSLSLPLLFFFFFFLHAIGIRATRSLSLPAFQRFPALFFFLFFFRTSLLKDRSMF